MRQEEAEEAEEAEALEVAAAVVGGEEATEEEVTIQSSRNDLGSSAKHN